MSLQAAPTRAPIEQRFLIILFGTLEYDGRAKRVLEILKGVGHVTVVDVADGRVDRTTVAADVHRVQLRLPMQAKNIRRHMFFWWGALRSARRENPSVVVAEDYFTTLLGRILARRCRAKLIYDAHELIIPDFTRVMTKRDRFWYLLERWTVRRVDLVIAANEERAKLMAEHYCLKQTPTVMRNIPASAPIMTTKEDALHQWPILCRRTPNEVLMLYQGDVNLSRGIGRFIQALGYLGSEYRMVIVGGGPDLENIRTIGQPFVRDGRLVILGLIEHRLLPSLTAMADVGIVTYPFKGLNNIYCAPNKIFEYAQAGIPMVTTNQPPLRRLVQSYGIGRLVGEHDGPEQLATVIQEVIRNKHKYAEGLFRLLDEYRCQSEADRVKAAIGILLTKSQ